MARSDDQLKLHAAIAAVLVDAAPRDGAEVWLTTTEIADRIAELDLYRTEEGPHPAAGQVAARVNKYPRTFERREASRVEVRLRLCPDG